MHLINKSSRLFITVSVLMTASPIWANPHKVSLYPRVQRVDQFKTALQTEWANFNTGIQSKIIIDGNVWDSGCDKAPLGSTHSSSVRYF